MSQHEIRLQRARQALEGLSVADALGGYFEFWRGQMNRRYLRERQPPDEIWRYTDDTEMALSIYACLCKHGTIEQDDLAQSFAQHFDESRAYGTGAMRLLQQIGAGGDWRELVTAMFRGEGSFGNGAAMRAAPIGAYFADDMPSLLHNARLASEVTHAHSEGIAGGLAVAIAAAVAVDSATQPSPTIYDFISVVLTHLPESEVKANCAKARTIPAETPIDEIAVLLGNGRNITAMDTVPIALWCAARWFDDFEEVIWQMISVGGDVDTTCAIVGGIIASRSTESIPAAWVAQREPLPAWALTCG